MHSRIFTVLGRETVTQGYGSCLGEIPEGTPSMVIEADGRV
jgi:hypothetical protein